jgi:hypothetical protein
MSTSYRRYEILLPRRYKDGRRVPARFVTETLVELREKFGAASSETQIIRGQWQYQGAWFIVTNWSESLLTSGKLERSLFL